MDQNDKSFPKIIIFVEYTFGYNIFCYLIVTILFAGYAKNLGTADALLVDYTDAEGNEYANIANNYLSKNTYANINSMWRLAPGVVRNWGKLALSLEWHITSVQWRVCETRRCVVRNCKEWYGGEQSPLDYQPPLADDAEI